LFEGRAARLLIVCFRSCNRMTEVRR
jgi:hypothetical protein